MIDHTKLLTRRSIVTGLAASSAIPSSALTQDRLVSLRRGINFHHVLSWPAVEGGTGDKTYTWPPFRAPNYRLTSEDLSRVKQLGFDFIRLTADPGILISAGEFKRRELADHIRQTIARIAGVGMAVVLDLHPTAVMDAYKPDVLVSPQSGPLFERYAEMAAWLAGALKDLPLGTLALELMNEPVIEQLSDAPRWQSMMEMLHAKARTAAPQLPLILSGLHWGSFEALMKINTTPFRQSAVLYTFHYYEPHSFTHQGVLRDDARYLSDVDWPMTAERSQLVLAKAGSRIDADRSLDGAGKAFWKDRSRKLVGRLISGGYDDQRPSKDFGQVARWATAHGIPPQRILLGEFGCVNVANRAPTPPSRLAWLQSVRSAAELFQFPWAYWSFKGNGGMELLDSRGSLDEGVARALGLELSSRG